jgi:HEAT repeat protein
VRALEDSSADGATKADAAKALGTFAGATAANKVPYTTAAAATAAVVMANALPPLVELLRSGSDDGRAVAAGALGILAGGAVGVMPVIVSAGALPPLVAMLSSGSEDGSKLYAAQALGVLAGGNVRIKSFVVGAGAIPQLVAMLSGGSDEGKRHASTALANLIPVGTASAQLSLSLIIPYFT